MTNQTFNFFKIFLGIATFLGFFLGLFTVITSNALFPNVKTIASRSIYNSKKYVHLLSDWHAVHRKIGPRQIKEFLQEVDRYKPEEVLVVIENNASFIPKSYKILKNDGFFARISDACKRKGIEVHDVDFRFTYHPEKHDIVDCLETDKMTLKEYLTLFDEVVTKNRVAMSKKQKNTYKKIKRVITRFLKPEQTVADFYRYCKKTGAMREKEIVDFTDSMVDAAILTSIKKSKKQHIFVLAGWWHTENIAKRLCTREYQKLFHEGLSYSQFGQEFDLDEAKLRKGQVFPAVNLKQYFAQVRPTLMA